MAVSIAMRFTSCGSSAAETTRSIATRPLGAPWVTFLTLLVMKSEFGTIRVERSNSSISVERTEMRRTLPWSVPITTQSPILIGRSASRMTPETKFEMTA